MFERSMLRMKGALFGNAGATSRRQAVDPVSAAPGEGSGQLADPALVLRMSQGDRAALAELYERHAQTLLSLAYLLLRDRPEAEDVLHDVFLEAYRRAAEYSEVRGSVRTWLLLRTRSRALDRLRSKGRRQSLLLGVTRESEQAGGKPSDLAGIADRHRLPAALAQIPEPQQRVIELAYFEGLSTVEISSRLGIPAGTVKSRTHAAITALRSALAVSDD